MKKHMNFHHHHFGWGVLIALFGVFFLLANLIPHHDILRYWPIFLIAAGVYKALACNSCCSTTKKH